MTDKISAEHNISSGIKWEKEKENLAENHVSTKILTAKHIHVLNNNSTTEESIISKNNQINELTENSNSPLKITINIPNDNQLFEASTNYDDKYIRIFSEETFSTPNAVKLNEENLKILTEYLSASTENSNNFNSTSKKPHMLPKNIALPDFDDNLYNIFLQRDYRELNHTSKDTKPNYSVDYSYANEENETVWDEKNVIHFYENIIQNVREENDKYTIQNHIDVMKYISDCRINSSFEKALLLKKFNEEIYRILSEEDIDTRSETVLKCMFEQHQNEQNLVTQISASKETCLALSNITQILIDAKQDEVTLTINEEIENHSEYLKHSDNIRSALTQNILESTAEFKNRIREMFWEMENLVISMENEIENCLKISEKLCWDYLNGYIGKFIKCVNV